MSTLVARLSSDTAVHELCRDEGGYVLRTYLETPPPQVEKRLTLLQAGEWVDTVRRCGGNVYEKRMVGA